MAMGYSAADTPSLLADEHVQNSLAVLRMNRLVVNDNQTGICQHEDCGDTIPAARLQLVPNARFCVSCQAKADRVKVHSLSRGRPQGQF